MKQQIDGYSITEATHVAFLAGRAVQFIGDEAEKARIPLTSLASAVVSHLREELISPPANGGTQVRRSSVEDGVVPFSRAARSKALPRVVAHRAARAEPHHRTLRAAKAALKKGLSINAVAKKYHLQWPRVAALVKST